MSVRAYRVNSMEMQEEPTFNLWHDSGIMDCLEADGFTVDGTDGGMLEVSVEALENAIKNAKTFEIDDEIITSLKEDIKWAKEKNEDYIQYNCY